MNTSIDASSTSKVSGYFSILGKSFNLSAEVGDDIATTFVADLGELDMPTIAGWLISLFKPSATFVQFPPPWDFLNKISFEGLKVIIEGKNDNVPGSANRVGFSYDISLDYGFVVIEKLTINYNVDEKNVEISLVGQLLGLEIPSWDIYPKNDAPPVPGYGDEYFDLIFFGMGQRLSIYEAGNITSVGEAITELRGAFEEPEPVFKLVPEKGDLVFNPNSNWLIGTQFIVIKTVDLSIIFNDPQLYGIRLALSGDKAKSFAGLEVEILYRQVTDNIGVYQLELKLPDAMRQMDIGAVSLTLPVVGIAIYTNGNFKIDFGFPYDADFSRSFTVQAFPFIGAGGFYFALLTGETSPRLPADYAPATGSFNPVIDFGLGLRLGFGKEINKGILEAGISITVQGIVMGTLAFFNPDKSAYPEKKDDVYYWLNGQFLIVGRLYGTVDFSIISATFDLTVYVSLGVTIESYQPVILHLEAGVTINLKVRINLGLFKITVKLSFEFNVSYTFELPAIEKGIPQWALPTEAGATTFGARRYRRRFRSIRMSRRTLPVKKITWQAVTPQDYVKEPLTVYFLPQLSVAESSVAQGASTGQQAVFISMLFLKSAEQEVDLHELAPEEYAFERLAQALFIWVVSSYQQTDWTSKTLRQFLTEEPVSYEHLEETFDYLSSTDIPISYQDIQDFLDEYFDITLTSAQDPIITELSQNEDDFNVSVFPMFPDLQMTVSLDGNIINTTDFSTETIVGEAYHKILTAYFSELAARYQSKIEKANDSQEQQSCQQSDEEQSLATFIFQDFFLLQARNSVQSAMDLLDSYPLTVTADDSLKHLTQLYDHPDEDNPTMDILETNQTIPLEAQKRLFISGLNYAVQNGDTFFSIATNYFIEDPDSFYTSLAGYGENDQIKGIFIEGKFILTGPDTMYLVENGDSLLSITDKELVTISPAELVRLNAQVPDILNPFILLSIPNFDYYTQPEDNISGIVNKLKVSLENLGKANQENEAVIFPLGTEITLPHLPGLPMDSILEGLIDNKTFSNQAGMTSRNLMAGMRPPNPAEETLWKGPAFWTADDPGTAGLYELTGQQFVLPELDKDNSTYVIVLEKNEEPTGWAGESKRRRSWYQITCEKAPEIEAETAEITLSGLDIEEILALQESRLEPEIESLTKPSLFTVNAQGFSLGSSSVWQTNRPVFVQGPTGTASPNAPRPWGGTGLTGGPGPTGWVEVTEPMVWYVSDEFKETLAQKKMVLPKFQLAIDKRTPLNPAIENQEVNASGWSSILKLDISIVPSTVNSPNNVPYTYAIEGADEDGIKLLEQLIINQNQLGVPVEEKVDIGQIHFLYYPNPTDQNNAGFRSDGIAQTETFILKTNLSTQSNPELSGGLSLQSSLWEENWVENNLLNSLELIWEASIVRSGGYFLYYRNLGTNAGFPESMFDDSGKATIQILITYGITEQHLPAFVNCAVLGDKVEENALLVAESLPQCIRNFSPVASLEQIMQEYNVSLGDLAERVRSLPINAAQPPIEVRGIVFQLDSNDWTLDSIAIHFNVAPEAIEALNPTVDFDDLKIMMAIKIPTVEYPANNGPITFNDLAQTYGVTVTSLAYHNREREELFAEGNEIDFNNELIKKSSTIPPGNVAFKLLRKNPELADFLVDEAGEDPRLTLELNYNLLGYRIENNQSFDASVSGLPISPEGATGATGATPIDPCEPTDNFATQDATGTTDLEDPYWNYNRVVPAFPYAKTLDNDDNGPQFPKAELNPYLGTGDIIQMNLDWVDSYGNKTVNPFNAPDEFPLNKVLNNFPVLIGYTDEVIGVDKWPSTSSSYIFQTDSDLGAALQLDFNFDISKYAPTCKENEIGDADEDCRDAIKVAKEGAAADLQTFKTVYYQLGSEDMEVSLRSSTDDSNVTKGPVIKEPLQLFIQQVCHFLQAISSGTYDYTFHKRIEGETLAEVAAYYEVDLNLLTAFNPGAEEAITTGEEPDTMLAIPDFNFKFYPTNGIETFEEIAQKFKITEGNLKAYNPGVSDPPPDTGLLLIPNFKFINYITQVDDTLQCIAEKFEISVDAIEAMNPGTPENPPTETLLVLPDFLYEIYVTKEGDTLEKIAEEFEVPYQVLRGMPPYFQTPPAEGSQLVIPTYDFKTYTTQAGDSLAIIAKDNRVLLPVLERINPDADFDPPAGTTVIIPKEPLNQAIVLGSTFSPNNEAIFPLSIQLSFHRLNHIDDQFLDEPSVQTANTFLRPLVLSPDDCTLHSAEESDSTASGLSLLCFAKSFEHTFADTKIAITHSPLSSKSEQDIREVWVIRLAEAASSPQGPQAVDNIIDFDIKTDNGAGVENNVHFFAPVPLNGYPLSGKFTIQDYARGIGLTGAHDVSYSNVKLDEWGQDLLTAVDQFLEADYVTPAFILDQQFNTSYVDSILDSKEKIATAYRELVQEIVLPEVETGNENNSNANPDAARDILEQEMLIKLSSAFSFEAIVQLYTEVQSPFDGPNPPQLFGSPQGVKMIVNEGSLIIEEDGEAEFTLSTSRIPLESGKSNLSFLFSTKRVEDNKNIKLKLDYSLTAVEFDIKDVDGIEGYKASTWLYFVNPPEAREIGEVDIPLLFRAYPTPPSLVEQRAQGTSPETLEETRMWQYSYGYQQVEAAQDIIHTNIRFNVSQNEVELNTFDKSDPDLFEALAEFMNTYPGIQQDLVTFLLDINENSTDNQINLAQIAIQSFEAVVAAAAEAWPYWLKVREKEYTPDLSSPYDSEFSITEPFLHQPDKVVLRKEHQYLMAEPTDYFWVEVEGVELSGGADFPFIKITNAITTTIAPSSSARKEKEDLNGQIVRYYFLNIEDPSQYLTLEDVSDQHVRLIVFGGWEDQQISSNLGLSATTANLDVMEKQNAWGGVAIRRNQYLFDNENGTPDRGKPTNPNFIYRTSTIRFSNLITPLLESRLAFNIAEFPTPADPSGKNASYERPLIEHLQALFYNYFGGVEAIKNRKIKLNLTYTYHLPDPVPMSTEINPLKINVPAHFVPPFEFNIPADWEYDGPTGLCQELDGDLSFICILDEKIRAWYNLHQPPGAAQAARFIFEISTFSTFSDSKLPVYKLSDLYLKLEDINPSI